MIKQLKRRFVVSIIITAFVVLVTILASVDLLTLASMDRRTTQTLVELSENDGVLVEDSFNVGINGDIVNTLQYFNPLEIELYYSNRFFAVEISKDGLATGIYTRRLDDVTDAQAVHCARLAMETGKTTGYIKGPYKFLTVESENATEVYFLDISSELANAGSLVTITFITGITSFVILSIAGFITSDKAIRPVMKNAQRQKQFITGAGHELKTPLAIIAANSDVLELTYGKNEWLDSIHKQTQRLSELVNRFIILAKADEGSSKKDFESFDLSSTVRSIADSFEVIAEQNNKKIVLELEPDVILYGNSSSVNMLVSVLCDNALKYSAANSEIVIKLNKRLNKIVLETVNKIDGDFEFDVERLFDRFYRSDSSRSRETGGYGIGLSIAKAVVEMHKGTINARRENSTVTFTAVFNQK